MNNDNNSVTRKTTIRTTTEVENMTRKAATLKSLDELNLAARTKTYLRKNFGSIDKIVSEGRRDAFEQDLGIQIKEKAPKWKSELISALMDGGFIRPTADFLMTFRVNAIYCIAHREWKNHFVSNIGQLSNEQYETFLGLSTQCIEDVKSSLRERLSEREYKVISLRFGLDYNGVSRSLEAIGRVMNVTHERICQLEARAYRKLRHPITTLPAIFEAPSDLEKTAEALNAELEELYKSPAFKRANEITKELERMKKTPFRYSCAWFEAGSLDNTDIDELELSVRSYYCLKHAGIRTVADIINLPNEKWAKIRNLGRKSLQEVIEKVHAAGYPDFSVNLS